MPNECVGMALELTLHAGPLLVDDDVAASRRRRRVSVVRCVHLAVVNQSPRLAIPDPDAESIDAVASADGAVDGGEEEGVVAAPLTVPVPLN